MDCAAEEQLVRMALSDIDQINRIEVDLDQRDVLIDHTDVGSGWASESAAVVESGTPSIENVVTSPLVGSVTIAV